uniref:Odorant receptor n=1 Tax=Anopheles christyi TaxID=43041 RepID=A0A182KED4_9DIPT
MENHITKQQSLKRFQATVAWQNRILSLFGCYMYLGKQQVSYRIVPICFIASSYIVLTLYCAVQAWGDMGQVVLSIVAVFYALIGVTRLAVAISNPTGCYRSIQLAEEMYRRANGSHPAECVVLAKYTDMFCKSVHFYTLCYLLGVTVVALMPFGFYLFRGERFLPLGIVFPFTDNEDSYGYWCTLAIQLGYMLPGTLALVPSQNIYFAFVFNICLQYDLLIERLKQLDERIREPDSQTEDVNSMSIREQLVEIIQLQQLSISYITHIEHFYQLQSFVEFICNSLQATLTLSELHRSFWLPGFFVFPVAVGQMLILCILGTLIEVKSDHFTDQLYNIAWSEMKLPEQVMFQYVLSSAQQSSQLTCGGFADINMNLFVAIHKKIYSFFMMLQNM